MYFVALIVRPYGTLQIVGNTVDSREESEILLKFVSGLCYLFLGDSLQFFILIFLLKLSSWEGEGFQDFLT